jgi:hypothetical protein
VRGDQVGRCGQSIPVSTGLPGAAVRRYRGAASSGRRWKVKSPFTMSMAGLKSGRTIVLEDEMVLATEFLPLGQARDVKSGVLFSSSDPAGCQ